MESSDVCTAIQPGDEIDLHALDLYSIDTNHFIILHHKPHRWNVQHLLIDFVCSISLIEFIIITEQEIDGATLMSCTERMTERLAPNMKKQCMLAKPIGQLKKNDCPPSQEQIQNVISLHDPECCHIAWSHSLRFTGNKWQMATLAWFTCISSTSSGNAWQEGPIPCETGEVKGSVSAHNRFIWPNYKVHVVRPPQTIPTVKCYSFPIVHALFAMYWSTLTPHSLCCNVLSRDIDTNLRYFISGTLHITSTMMYCLHSSSSILSSGTSVHQAMSVILFHAIHYKKFNDSLTLCKQCIILSSWIILGTLSFTDVASELLGNSWIA